MQSGSVPAYRSRTPTALRTLGIASAVVLTAQVEAREWLRGPAIVAAGAVLGAVAAPQRNRSAAGDGDAPAG
ncbi:hypothetical protein AB0937_37255 [Streptomyces sp. NPDC047880]|uniref:hypothetical protein n=1 Tax=Streptomyces sp. NPDC047880 TaxID=3155626 RepID=UPI003451F210